MDAYGPLTWYHRWGDTLLASMAGTSAAWIGSEPYQWQRAQAFAVPEAYPLGAWWDARATYDRTVGTDARRAAQRAEWCQRIPRPLRWLIAPCVGAELGGLAVGRGAAAVAGDTLLWLAGAVALVAGIWALGRD